VTADTRHPRSEPEKPALVIRDKRRVDPATGQVRPQASGRPEPSAPAFARLGTAAGVSGPPRSADTAEEELTLLRTRLAERTADLQRVKAEYDNYRKRVERQRQMISEAALAAVLAELLPLLDDVGRARESGELTGGIKAIAESLESRLAKLGLRRFGEPGEQFDPTMHEAISHAYSDEVDQPTCTAILQPGYQVGERQLRPARVAVAEPTAPFGPLEHEAEHPT
jgi:molecular chaperone GrpE